MLTEFALPPELEARAPVEARGVPRDGVRMLVSRRSSGEISHHAFGDLPGLLLPGDLLVVNTSATVPAAIRIAGGLAVHFSSPRPDGDWLIELRERQGGATVPYHGGIPGQPLWLHIVTLAAVALGTGNVVGGFVVTDRMLEMFKRRKPTPQEQPAEQGTEQPK